MVFQNFQLFPHRTVIGNIIEGPVSVLKQDRAQAIGEAEVLLSSNGCVVVCTGADSPAVRLDVTNAVAAYTGLGSNEICIIKMKSGGSEKRRRISSETS